jgi:hypothetical protein
MSRTRTLCAATAVAVGSSTALIFCGVAAADPVASPQPIPGAQLPGMPAIEQLSPVIQQAAADPGSASSLLMAAAAAFTGTSAAPSDSKQVADSVTQFVQTPAGDNILPHAQVTHLPETVPGTGIPLPAGVNVPGAGRPVDPAAHIPTTGSAPGGVAHLPTGVDPANAVGPAPQAIPHAVPHAAPPGPQAAPAPVPEAAPAPVPEAAPAPVPEAAPAPVPDAVPDGAPAFGPDSPPTQDFMYPSIGQGCLADGGSVIATALSVAGPANIPAPGPAPGQTAYVFTAVGTPGPADVQKLPLNVTWVNLTTGKSGSATLKPRPDINPDGPTTLTVVADTGSGSIMSTIFGQVSTKDNQCNFLPTIGSTVVP